jgi:hypothetical protein
MSSITKGKPQTRLSLFSSLEGVSFIRPLARKRSRRKLNKWVHHNGCIELSYTARRIGII